MMKMLPILALVTLGAMHGKGILKLEDRRLVAGDTVRVRGEKFPKLETSVLLLVGTHHRTRLSEIRTDTAGAFTVVPVIPATEPPGAYRLIVVASDGDEVGALDVEVIARAAAAHQPGHEAEMAEPSNQPLSLHRARGPWVTGVAWAAVGVAMLTAGLLLRRPTVS